MPQRDTGWLDGWPRILRDEPLARHNQYGVGGPADWFLVLRDPQPLHELLPRCAEAAIPVSVLGAGSNTLVLDGGVRGLVVKLVDRRLRIPDDRTVELSGGYMMPRAALDCARRAMAGLEFGIGIPGTCGASVRGNAGAFGTEIKDVLIACDTVAVDGELHTFAAADCGFDYRHSRFKEELRDHVVVAARFYVHHDEAAAVRARTDEVTALRKAGQPWGIRSLGSVFKNPPDDHAGRLVEAAGMKGRRVGGAQISPRHANFIVNVDNASAADVLSLIAVAHDAVLERFGIDLEEEIVIMGEQP